ncbi:MAG: hypothetical protein H8E32_03045 [Nitrospinae bacterium]|nr:hypothetical protein [Nitrospinota bacterium]
MSEAKSYHFNSNIRSKTGSKTSMSNNEDRFLRALEIQDAKQALIDEKLEKQRIIDEAEKAVADEKARQEAEAKAAQAAEEAANAPVEEAVIVEAPAAEEAAPAPATTKPAPSGNNVPGPTPRKDFSSEERSAMLKRAKAHAAEVAKRKG